MTFDVEQYARSIENEYDLPKNLEFNSYYDNTRDADITQIYFRYSPFSNSINAPDKFAFEVAANDSVPPDIHKRNVKNGLSSMVDAWKSAFNFVFWRNTAYAANEQDGVFTVKCESCHSARSIQKPGDFEYRRDLYLIYLLKEIEHDCSEDWKTPNGSDMDCLVPEGTTLPRTSM